MNIAHLQLRLEQGAFQPRARQSAQEMRAARRGAHFVRNPGRMAAGTAGTHDAKPSGMNNLLDLPVRQRTVHAGDGESVTTQSVYCPRRARAVSVDECEQCDHGRVVSRVLGGGQVLCAGPWLARDDLSANTGSVASRTPIAEVMTTGVRCVLDDVRVDELTELMLTHGLSGMPVVDLEGIPIGVVSKTDLMRDPGPGAVVDDVMTPIAFTLD